MALAKARAFCRSICGLRSDKHYQVNTSAVPGEDSILGEQMSVLISHSSLIPPSLMTVPEHIIICNVNLTAEQECVCAEQGKARQLLGGELQSWGKRTPGPSLLLSLSAAGVDSSPRQEREQNRNWKMEAAGNS